MPSELKGFADVAGGDAGGTLQIGQGSGHPEHAIVPAGGKTEAFHRVPQELRPAGIRRRDFPQDPG